MNELTRRAFGSGALLASVTLATSPTAQAQAATTLRIGMTASDIPLTTGGPDNGFEGFRFTGYTLYDALVQWDLSRADQPSKLIPSLATSWSVDPADRTKWAFRLRPGVKFHDGSAFDATAVTWNFAKLLDQSAPQYDVKQAAQIRGRITSVKSWRAVDPMTIEITTNAPDAFLPYALTFVLFSSPAQFETLGGDWLKFAASPSGTGPWMLTRLVPRQSAEMVRNTEYWDKGRRPRIDKLVLLPIPEANTRVAALLSGQIDWAEAPSPEQIPKLRSAGNTVLTNVYPHVWTYMLSMLPGSPFEDIRVRRAINLAIDRDGMTTLLNGMMQPAVGSVPPSNPWFGTPSFDVRHDPAEARRLLAEAGYTEAKPLSFKVAISTSGSGQMQPLIMNEFIQQNLAAVGVKLELEVMEWEQLLVRWRAGAQAEQNRGVPALNTSIGTFDPFNAFVRFYSSALAAPKGQNWGHIANPEYDAMLAEAQAEFDPAKQDAILARLNARTIDDAAFIWVAHDLNPRALSQHLSNVVQPQSWYIDLSSVEMKA